MFQSPICRSVPPGSYLDADGEQRSNEEHPAHPTLRASRTDPPYTTVSLKKTVPTTALPIGRVMRLIEGGV